MRRSRYLALAVLSVALARSPARAEDSDVDTARGFSSSFGLTGMRELIDARAPRDLNVRLMTVASYDRIELSSPRLSRRTDRLRDELIGGVSVLGALEGGARWFPFEHELVLDRPTGAAATRTRRHGAGDLDLAAKASLELEPVSLAPYAVLHLGVGEPAVQESTQLEVGGAFTLELAERFVGLHANLAFVEREAGRRAFRYRIGASGVLVATEDVVVRVFAFADGLEEGGARGSDVFLDAGVQAKFGPYLSVSLAVLGRVLDGAQRPLADRATFGVRPGIGASVTF